MQHILNQFQLFTNFASLKKIEFGFVHKLVNLCRSAPSNHEHVKVQVHLAFRPFGSKRAEWIGPWANL